MDAAIEIFLKEISKHDSDVKCYVKTNGNETNYCMFNLKPLVSHQYFSWSNNLEWFSFALQSVQGITHVHCTRASCWIKVGCTQLDAKLRLSWIHNLQSNNWKSIKLSVADKIEDVDFFDEIFGTLK